MRHKVRDEFSTAMWRFFRRPVAVVATIYAVVIIVVFLMVVIVNSL